MSQYLRNCYESVIEGNATVQKALAAVSGSRCLITGANGIIGYALSRLLDAHASVDVHLAVRNPNYLGSEILSDKVRYVDYSSLSGERFDYVFHCATYSQPAKFMAEWESTIRLSTDTLLRLLSVTDKRLVFAGSTEIYSGLAHEATEVDIGTSLPQHPRGIYIESKRVAEAACARSGIGSVSRIALAAGPYPGKNDSRVLFELIRKGRANGSISLLGGHQSIRQYQYTGSCALRMLVSGVLGTELVYNNAGPYVDTLENFAKAVAANLNVPYQVAEESAGIVGAPDVVHISMSRFHAEFPEMKHIDPPLDHFIQWVVGDCA